MNDYDVHLDDEDILRFIICEKYQFYIETLVHIFETVVYAFPTTKGHN